MAPSTPPQQAYRQTARDIVAIFFIKKHVFLMTLLGIFGGALGLGLLTPPTYETSTQLVVKPYNSKPLIFEQDLSRMNVFSEVTEQTLNTVLFLLSSPEVLQEVVLAHNLAPADNREKILDAMDALKGRIKAEPLTMSSVVKVTIRGRDPKAITDQLNTLVDAYIRHHIRVNQSTEGRLKFFNEQTEYFKNQYEKLNQELARTGKNLDIVDPVIQKENNLRLIKDLELSKLQLSNQIETFTGKIDSFRAALKRFKGDGALVGLPAEAMMTYPALVEMEKSLAQLQINRQRASNDFHANAKPVLDADQQIGNMRLQVRRSMEQIISDLETQVAALRRSIEEADRKIAEAQHNGQSLLGNSLELERLTMEHKLIKDNYMLYSTKKEEARINEEKDRANFANVTVANRPVTPTSPWFPQPTKIIMLAIPLGLMLAFAFSAIAYALEQRLWTPTDISLHSRLRVLGTFDEIASPATQSQLPSGLFRLRWAK